MPAHKKYLTEEDRKRATRESYIKYNMSEKGKARSNNFKQTITEEYKEKQRNDSKARYDSLSPEKKKSMLINSAINSKKRHRKDPRKRMLSDAKRRAKAKGIEFSLSLQDIEIPQICPVLGVEIFVAGDKSTPNSPSIDRIDNTKGYTSDNIMVISLRANMLKNDGTLDEFINIVKYMENNLCHGME